MFSRRHALTLFIAFILASTVANGFSGHSTPRSISINEDLRINLHNEASEEVTFHLKHEADSNWKTYQNTDGITIPADDLAVPGIYRYYLSSSSTTTPTQVFTANAERSPFTDALDNQISRYYTNNTFNCKPGTNQSTCHYEHYQAAMITSLLGEGHRTDNQSMISQAYTLLNNNWSEGPGVDSNGCDPRRHDYSCETWNNLDAKTGTKGSERQSRIIDYLWDAYRITGNATIYEYAENFTDGSAEDCDVWNNDYNCDRADDQAHMTLAYLEAYAVTGQTSYKDVAENLLSNVSPTTPKGFHASLKAHHLLNTPQAASLTQTAVQNPPRCNEPCTTSAKRHIIRAWQIYSMTQDGTYTFTHNGTEVNITKRYRGQREQFQPHRFNTSHDVYTPLSVANIANAHRRTTQTYPANASTANHIRPISPPQIEQDNIFQTKLYGNISNVSLTYENPDKAVDTPVSVQTNDYGVFTVPKADVQSSKFINVSLDEQSVSHDTTISIPATNTNYQSTLRDVLTDPREYCEPYENDDYQCLYEYMQAEYAHGIHDGQRQVNNTYGITTTMMQADIDPTGGRYSSCDPFGDDYTCENTPEDDIPTAQDEEGVYRAGLMIQSHVTAFHETKNPVFLAKARQYAYNTHEGCTDYSSNACNATSLATLLNGVIALQTAQPSHDLATIRDDIATNLKSQVPTAPTTKQTPRAVTALLRHYSQADAQSSLTTAKTYLEANQSVCTGSRTCPPERLYLRTTAYWLLYNSLREQKHYQQGNSLISSQPDTEQNACNPSTQNPSAVNENKCNYPDEQGTILSAYAAANKHHVLRSPPNISVSITSGTVYDFGDQDTVTCYAENVGSRTANLTALQLLTDQTINGVSASGNASFTQEATEVRISDFAPTEYVNASFNVTYTRGGKGTLRCASLLSEDENEIKVTDIGRVSNTSQIRTRALSNNGYTSKYSFVNNKTFGVSNVTINTSHPVKTATNPWNKTSNQTITASLWREGQPSNITLQHNKSNEGVKNTGFNITGQFGVNQSATYNVTIIENTLTRNTALPNFTIFEPEQYDSTVTNNHPLPINLTINIAHPSALNTTLTHDNTTTGNSLNTVLAPNQTYTYTSNVTVTEDTTPSITTSYSATGIQQSTTKASRVKTDLLAINVDDAEVPSDGSYQHSANVTNNAAGKVTDTKVTLNPGGPIDITDTTLKPITITKTNNRSLTQATLDNTTVTSQLTSDDNNIVSTDQQLNLTFQDTSNIKDTTVTITTNETFIATLSNDDNTKQCTINPPRSMCSGFKTTTFQLAPNHTAYIDSVLLTATYDQEKQGQDSPIKISSMTPGQTRQFTFTTKNHNELPQDINLSAQSNEGVTTKTIMRLNAQASGGGSTGSEEQNGGSSSGNSASGGSIGGSPAVEEAANKTWTYQYTLSAKEMSDQVSSLITQENLRKRYNKSSPTCFVLNKSVKQTAPHAITVNYSSCLGQTKYTVFDPLPTELSTENMQKGYAVSNATNNATVSYQATGPEQRRNAFDQSPLIVPSPAISSDAPLDRATNQTQLENRNQTVSAYENRSNDNKSNATAGADDHNEPRNEENQRQAFILYISLGLLLSLILAYATTKYMRSTRTHYEAELEYLKAKRAFADEFSSYRQSKKRLTPAEDKLLSMKLKLIRIENLIDGNDYDQAREAFQRYGKYVDKHLHHIEEQLTKRGEKQLDYIAKRTKATAAAINNHFDRSEEQNKQSVSTEKINEETSEETDEEPENPAPDLYIKIQKVELLLNDRKYEEAVSTLDTVKEEAEDMKELYPEESKFLQLRTNELRQKVKEQQEDDLWYQLEQRINTYLKGETTKLNSFYFWKS